MDQIQCKKRSSDIILFTYQCRYYFQLLATEVLNAQGFYGIIRHFGWRKVGVIVQDENLFTAVRIELCIYNILHLTFLLQTV